MTGPRQSRLLRLNVTAFGVLSLPDHPFDFADDRITLILGDNETGKTTLAEALFAALYGVEHRESVKNTFLPHASRWRPIANSPAAFGAELRAVHNGREIVAAWDFNARLLKVTDALTGKDLTDDFRVGRNEYDLGRQLTGWTPEEFRKVCFIGQGEVSDANSVQGISALVQRFAATAPGENTTAAEAIVALDRAIREYPGTTGKGSTLMLSNEIDRLTSQRDEIAEQLQRLHEERAAASQDEARYEDLKGQERTLQQKIDLTRHLQHKAEWNEVRGQLAAAGSAASHLAELERERDNLAHLAAFPEQDSARLDQCQGRLKGDSEALTRVKNTLDDELRPILDSRNSDLEAMGAFKDATKEEQKELLGLRAVAQELQPRMTKLRTEMKEEEARLSALGIKSAELPGLRKRLAPLSESDLTEAAAYPAARANAAEKLRAANDSLSQVHALLADIRLTRRRAKARSFTMVLAALVIAGGSGFFEAWLMWLGLGLAAVAFTIGLIQWFVAAKARSQEHEDAVKELQKSDEEAVAVRGDLRRLDGSATGLAQACGFKSPDQLAEAAVRFREVDRQCAKMTSLKDQWDRAQEDAGSVLSRARLLAERFQQPMNESDLPGSLASLLERVERACALQEKYNAQAIKVAREESLSADLSARIEQTEGAIRQILKSAGISAEDLNQGIDRFAALRKQFARYARLVEELIPDQKIRIGTFGAPAALQSGVAKAEQRVSEEVALRQEWSQAAPDRASKDYAEEAGDLVDQLRAVSEERHNLGISVSGSLARWQEIALRLIEERDGVEERLARALRHQKALDLALKELRDVAGAVHAEWAAELNERASRLLSHFAPSLHQVRFEEDLTFHVLRRADGREVTDTPAGPALSMGQKDQLYLAVRLGIAGFAAGKSGGLPIILDDPFVNFDDGRFAEAMRFLADEAAAEHQVILFTCHRERFAWLRRQDPDWFESRICQRGIP